MKISPDFHDWELTVSTEHPDLVTPLVDVDPLHIANAMRVVLGHLQPTRDFAGQVTTLSFIRYAELNAAAGSKPTSSHLLGLAADYRPSEISALDLFESFQRMDVPGATWDKLNLYTGSRPYIHVAFRPVEEGQGRLRIYRDWELLNG